MAVAGVTEAVEDRHLPSQVRRGSAERQLGHHGCPLCGGVRYPSVDQAVAGDILFFVGNFDPNLPDP